MEVIKRDGRKTNFNIEKIKRGIKDASNSLEKEFQISDEKLEKVLELIENKLKDKETIEAEELLTVVQNALMNKNCYEVAAEYIKYAEDRNKERFRKLEIMKEIKEKLDASNVQNQNANLDEHSFGGRKGEADSALLKKMALDYYISPKYAKNHINNRIYIHDLDSYVLGLHNCVQDTSWVKVSINGNVKTLQLADLIKMYKNQEKNGEIDFTNYNIQILARDGFTTLKKLWVRKTKTNEKVYTIYPVNGLPLVVTGEHKIPVLRNDQEVLMQAKDIQENDKLISSCADISQLDCKEHFFNLLDLASDTDLDLRIANSRKIYTYLTYKYDVYYTHIANKLNLSNKANIDIDMTLRDLTILMQNFAFDWDCLSSLRVKASGSKKTYPLFIPLTQSFAKLYAYLYADGNVYASKERNSYQVQFTNTNLDIAKDFVKCYKEVFGYSLNIHMPRNNWNSPCIRVTDGSRLAVKLFESFAGAKKKNSADISMPDFVLNGDADMQLAYFGACIDTDGAITTRGITYTTVGERYSQQVFLLLSKLGYHPNLHCKRDKGTKYRIGKVSGTRNYNSYYIELTKKSECIDILSKINIAKNKDKIAYNGISSKLRNDIIRKITIDTKERVVVDLETESHWFIANNYIVHNCLSVPLDELLANGFKTRQVFIRPAGSVNTALQLIAVLFQLQSLQQFGGVAGTHVDWTLVPYIRKSFFKHFKDGLKYVERKPLFSTFDKVLTEIKKESITEISIEDKRYKKYKKAYQYALDMLRKEVYQGCEGLAHNLNSLQSRAGNQLPFSSINYGTCTEPEGRMFTKAMLDVTIKGVGNGQTSIFPCQIFQYKKGVNDKEGTPNHDLFKLAIECTSKRLYPNYVNCDWSGDAGYNEKDPRTYPSTMGCRTFSAVDINSPDEAHSHMKDGRGNIAPATIILPTLAMEAKKKAEHNQTEATDEFMKILDKAIDDCVGELVERFNWICAQNPASARFMYENNTFFSYGDDFEKEGIRGALKHGTLAVGQLGLAECLQVLLGCDHTTKKGMDFAKKIEQLYLDKCMNYKEKLKLNIGVYFTPAESLCGTAMKKFKTKYGVIPNVSDHEYFTNSIHVPVWKEISPFEKIDIESQLTKYHRAGCITYVEIGDNAKNNLKGLEQIVKYAMDKDVPYFALNLPLSHCTCCGSDENIGFDDVCPICGANADKVEHLARVTGYLSTDYKHFNTGKQAEVRQRYTHVNKLKDWKK